MAIGRGGFKLPKVQPPGDAVVKNSPAYAGDRGDKSLLPGLGRSPGGGNEMATHSSILAERISWVGDSLGHNKSDTTENTGMKAGSEEGSTEGFRFAAPLGLPGRNKCLQAE